MKKKTITLFILVTILTLIIPINVFADYSGIDTDVTIGGTGDATSSLIINRMLAIFQAVGTIIAVVALIIIGIRYMLSSVNEKASLKGILPYYFIGALLVLFTANFVKFVYDIITAI